MDVGRAPSLGVYRASHGAQEVHGGTTCPRGFSASQLDMELRDPKSWGPLRSDKHTDPTVLRPKTRISGV